MVAALCVILIVAIVIKPLVTGQPVNTGISSPTTQIMTVTSGEGYPTFTYITTTPATTPPTKVPTWNSQVQSVSFVDPSTYHISATQTFTTGSRINATQSSTGLVTFATISGKSSGTTRIINIPFPYWEISYTLEPATGPMGGLTEIPSMEITPTLGENYAHSGISGSYSAVMPTFSIQVMDADDPNRFVRIITPPGGIDPDLWGGIERPTPEITRKPKYAETVATPTLSNTDPRPWTEKFYEGQRNYYFVINSRFIDSYTIDIKVPARYIGKY